MKPRLQQHYEDRVREKLMDEFGYRNGYEVPGIEKIVINVGVGDAGQNSKLLDSVLDEISIIAGQQPVVTKAKRSISNFGIREGMPVGVKVTLRRQRMFEFLDRLINVAIPRIRDFRGLPTRSFDGRGNYTLGIKEQTVFPEIDYDEIVEMHGMDIVFVTSTDRDDEAIALLREMGFPFRGETPVVVSGKDIPGGAAENGG